MLSYPLGDGGVLTAGAASPGDAGCLELAPAEDRLHKAEKRLRSAGEILESAPEKVTSGLKAVTARLRELSLNEVAVESGLTMTVESGVVVDKGSAEVHFTVTMTWNSTNGNGGESLEQPGGNGIDEAGRREGER